ncbi:unnamed protein product, partial [Rotaria sp. Silwood2]
MYSVVDSQKGSNSIHFQDNLYRLQKCNKNGSTRWVCTNRYCSSSITIRNEIIQSQRGKHNHTNVKRSVSIIKAVKAMRQEVRNNISKPVTQIYSEFLSEYKHMNGTAESVPIFDMLRSTLYRDRSIVLPKYPTCIRDLVVPADFMNNLYNEPMLFCDETEPTRILGFCSLSAMKELGIKIIHSLLYDLMNKKKSLIDVCQIFIAQCNIWNSDGTFKTAPKLFGQAYTIHVHNEFSMKPVLFAALEDKSEVTYLRLLQSLIQYAQCNGFTLSPSSILIDFEMAAFNAFRIIFPKAKIIFCHFHFAKNIMKHLKKL